MPTQSKSSRIPIPPEKVKRDNSDIYKYSRELFIELRKCRYPGKTAQPNHYVEFAPYFDETDAQVRMLHRSGTPMDDIGNYLVSIFQPSFDEQSNFNMDIKKFISELESTDAQIFIGAYIIGMKQREIAVGLGMTQPRVSDKCKALLEKFKDFYTRD